MADIFISYASEDREQAQTLADALESLGWSVFWDRTIPTGEDWHSYIGAALDEAKCIIVLWSPTSAQSRWVIEEANEAVDKNILMPVLIKSCEPPRGFRAIQAADLSGWAGSAESLVKTGLTADIGRVVPRTASPAPNAETFGAAPSAPPGAEVTVTRHVSSRARPAHRTRQRTESPASIQTPTDEIPGPKADSNNRLSASNKAKHRVTTTSVPRRDITWRCLIYWLLILFMVLVGFLAILETGIV